MAAAMTTIAEAYTKLTDKIKEVKDLQRQMFEFNEKVKAAGVEPIPWIELHRLEDRIRSRVWALEQGIEKLVALAYKQDAENGTDKPSY